MKFKPLLAAKADPSKITYPVVASAKIDGIRVITKDNKVISRTGKPIPNKFLTEMLLPFQHLDGEVIVDNDFNKTSSCVMSRDGEFDFVYKVFDHIEHPDKPYLDRIRILEELTWDWPNYLDLLETHTIHTEGALTYLIELHRKQGYEGTMIRVPDSPYKFGRSTVNQGYLLKIKHFEDDEGTLVGVTEKMINTNEQERSEFGYAKRSSAKDGLVPSGVAGSAIMSWNGKQFKVGFGPGYTDQDKKAFWENRNKLIGGLYKFSYQELTPDGVPRFGKLLGERHLDDLS